MSFTIFRRSHRLRLNGNKINVFGAMQKTYLNAQDYLRDAWRLAERVLSSHWRPDWLIGLWRGGALPAIAVHEYLAAKSVSVRQAPLVCSSYHGIGARAATVHIEDAEGWRTRIHTGERVLLVDDVYDSGCTIQAVRQLMESAGADVRSAVVYMKDVPREISAKPDYYVREWPNEWLVFPHELVGLTAEELAEKDELLSEKIQAGK